MTETRAPENDPRYYDFDAAFAELAGEGIPFRLLGELWHLPDDVPAETILRVQRLMALVAQMEAEVAKAKAEGREASIDADKVLAEDLSYERIVRDMIGDDLVDEWLRRRIGYRKLQAVCRRLFAIYTGDNPDEGDGQGEAPAANRAARRQAARKSTAKKTAKKSVARRN